MSGAAPVPDGLKRQGQPRNRDWAADALKAVFSMESRDKALENAEFVAKDMESSVCVQLVVAGLVTMIFRV
ncbi:hypothetical protein [Bifidobacterium longum]|uniref:hypothetical protein n=1 Tax=Bifidobacterium longum TaxID=216816 RepID=UPI00319E6578